MSDAFQLGKTLYFLYEQKVMIFNPEYLKTPQFMKEIIFNLTIDEEEKRQKVEDIDTIEL